MLIKNREETVWAKVIFAPSAGRSGEAPTERHDLKKRGSPGKKRPNKQFELICQQISTMCKKITLRADSAVCGVDQFKTVF
jgi:hypothetical protein